MEPMEFLSSPEHMDQVQGEDQGPGVFQTVRVETETLPPIVELGRSLLHKASEGNADAIRELMKQGAPFTTDWLGTSALHFACQYNRVEVVELLLKAGISKDARNKVDRTPLHVTAQEGHVQVLKLLLEYGVDVDSTDMLRMTALHWAAESGHEDCVKLLLEHGADPVAVNKFDKTPDQICFDNDRLDLCHVIQEYAENPLRHVHRKEAKERQKRAAAAHKALLEVEKLNKNPMNKFVMNGDKLMKLQQGGEIKEVRILKLPKKKFLPKVVFENELKRTNGIPTTQIKPIPQQVTMVTPQPLRGVYPRLSNQETREKTLQMLQAHGIQMLPADESTIVANAMQSGQKVVLTEAGKMALNLTETPKLLKPPTQAPVQKLIKLPPGLLKGKRVISIRADQLINMKNQQKVIIQTDKRLKPATMENMQGKNIVLQTQQGKQKVDVLVTKTTVNNQMQLTSSIVERSPQLISPLREGPTQLTSPIADRPAELNASTLSLDRLLDERLDVEMGDVSQVSTATEGESELERIKRELEETRAQMKMLQEQYLSKENQVRMLQEQYMRKEKEAEDYKREAQEYKKLVDVLEGNP